MTCYAYYRLPYADSYTVIESDGEPQILSSLKSIGGEDGFVISPFLQSDDCPIVLIRADRIKTISPQRSLDKQQEITAITLPVSPEYTSVFSSFHSAVKRGDFHKLVLARKNNISLKQGNNAKRYFEIACKQYPRLTIMLFSTPLTGTWLVASPEILIESKLESYHTVALAGTMPYKEGYAEWNDKNKEEQHVVEQYIKDTINPMVKDLVMDGPVTMRAGNLVHLRTDFRFHLKEGVNIGQLISLMHPTPAVCGFPKEKALEFIPKNEGLNRRYYSGFAGPIGINGENHLFVSLRCAELHEGSATLYAGGGIMPESGCQSEWQETENKMRTIRNVLE